MVELVRKCDLVDIVQCALKIDNFIKTSKLDVSKELYIGFTKKTSFLSINISWNQIKLGRQTKLTMGILMGMFLEVVTTGHSSHSNNP